MSSTVRALHDVLLERHRQEARWPNQRNADGTGPRSFALGSVPPAAKLRRRVDEHARLGILTDADVLLEEVAEAFAETDPAALRAELVQVAAVAVRWVERLDLEAAERRAREEALLALAAVPPVPQGSPHD